MRIPTERLQSMLDAANERARKEDALHQAEIRKELETLKLARLWQGCTEPWED